MDNFFSFILFVLIPLAIGILGIYFLIDFFEYLKKNHKTRYKQLSYASFFWNFGRKLLFTPHKTSSVDSFSFFAG